MKTLHKKDLFTAREPVHEAPCTTVDTSAALTLISAAFFRTVELIDSGDTAIISLIGADGKEVAVVLPLRVALEMARSLDRVNQSKAPEGNGR